MDYELLDSRTVSFFFPLSELLCSLCHSERAMKECFTHGLFKRTLGYGNLVAPWLALYHCKLWGGCTHVPPCCLFPQNNLWSFSPALQWLRHPKSCRLLTKERPRAEHKSAPRPQLAFKTFQPIAQKMQIQRNLLRRSGGNISLIFFAFVF